MPSKISLLPLLMILVGRLSGAQPDREAKDWKTATTNVPGREFPRVNSNRQAQFRIEAPGATNVSVRPLGQPLDIVRDHQGVWTITTSPLEVGFHYYQIIIDGVAAADPASETFFGWRKMMSGWEVPSPGEDFYPLQDVPHGEVRARWYHSKISESWQRCFVYAPPKYDRNQTERSPVLYLMHGAGEDERGWSTQGRLASSSTISSPPESPTRIPTFHRTPHMNGTLGGAASTNSHP